MIPLPPPVAPPALAARPRAVVLTYHDVIPSRGPGSVWFDCTTAELRDQLDYLKSRGATFVSIPQIEAAIVGGRPLPRRAVALTFADNYRGFLLRAWPILKARGIPATLFVHTDYVGSPVGRPKMTWAELGRLRSSGLVTVASQTRTHPENVSRLPDARLREEFVGSKAAIERKLGPCRYLAYPNGKYDARAARFARAAGYALAFTEVLAPIDRAPDRWRIPRYVHTKYRVAARDLSSPR